MYLPWKIVMEDTSMDETAKYFTDEELLLLCDGIKALEERAEQALSLIQNKEVHRIMNEEAWKYSNLQAKICGMMGKV